MKEITGIKAKVSISLFVYHITGFGLNYIYYGDSQRIVIVDSDGCGEIVSESAHEGELYYEEFIDMAKNFHLKMIEEQLTPFIRDVKCGSNN